MESDLLAFTAQLWPFAWTEEVPPVTSIAGFKLRHFLVTSVTSHDGVGDLLLDFNDAAQYTNK
uniref:Uncharacterized protein n=1 Tax=Magallana gigas TaxID=29159 RepID=K1QML2_MAGGI